MRSSTRVRAVLLTTFVGLIGGTLRAEESQPAAQPAASPEAPPLSASRFNSPVQVDGVLDEQVWSEAAPVPLSFEWSPGDNVTPPVKTTCYIGYDDINLYVACDAQDPNPAEIRAFYMDRDAVTAHSQDDHIIVMLDPFNDQRRAFQFRVNPLGVQVDGLFNEVDGGGEDFSWDAIWASAGKVTERGYAIEMALPLKQLRFPNTAGEQVWGVSFGRSYPRNFRHRINSHPRNRNASCLLCQINRTSGFSGFVAGRNVEIDPTVTLSRTDALAGFPDGGFTDGDEEADPGVDLRWGITPSLTLNATANPDFSQVEADVAQLAVNERFALFFPEKRTFFLEGQDFFDTPLNAVFTRTVVNPDWGAKLSGKMGDNALGVFVSRDRVNSLIFPSNQGSAQALLDEEVTSGVLRYRRDVGKNSTIGGLFTGRDGNDYRNQVAGADAFIRLAQSDDLRVQYLRSTTLYSDAVAQLFRQDDEEFSGDAIYARYQHLSRKIFAFVEYQDLDPGFRTDSGFIPRVDIRSVQGNLNHQIWTKGKTWWTQILYGGFFSATENHQGQRTDQNFSFPFRVLARYQSQIQIVPQLVEQSFRGTEYDDMARVFYDLRIQPTGSLRFGLAGTIGEVVDFTNNQPADQIQVQPTVEVRLSRRITSQLNHNYLRLDVDRGELFTANLTDLRLWYHFNLRTFVRAIFQYQNVDRDPALFVAPTQRTTETLLTQLLLSYELNPRTVLFVGYSDNQLGFDTLNQNVDLTRTDRTFFAKIGYGLIW